MMSIKSAIFWLLLYTKRNMMIDSFFDAMTAPIPYDWVALMLRLAVGLALLPYGIDKCMNRANAGKFHKVLFFSPAAGFYCVMAIETLVPIFLFAGMFTRLAVVPAIFSFAIAAWITLGKYGKSPASLYFLMMIVIFCVGGGNYSLDHYLGIWIK